MPDLLKSATPGAWRNVYAIHSLCGMLIGAAARIATSSIAFAGEQTLEFKLIVKSLDPMILQAANVDGQTMTATKAFGVAFFKDGRVAAQNVEMQRLFSGEEVRAVRQKRAQLQASYNPPGH